MNIVSIEKVPRARERICLRLSDGREVELAAEIVVREGLRKGEELTEEALGVLAREDGRWRTRETALRLLSYRPRSARELRQRLRRKGFGPEEVDWCLGHLDERGLVDDAAFAEMFSRDRVRLRPQGRRRLVQELRARGVDPETAMEAVQEVMQDEQVDELTLARQAASRWKPRAGEERERARRRLSGFLARRGFGADATRQVMEEVLGQE